MCHICCDDRYNLMLHGFIQEKHVILTQLTDLVMNSNEIKSSSILGFTMSKH